MKKYLLFESLSQSLSNKASNTQSFKVANKPGRSNGWKHLVLLFMFMVTMLGSYAQYSQSIVTGATSGATVNPITNVTASITDGSGITQTENYSSGSGGLNFGTGNSSGGFGADGSTSATITNADANGHYITYAISPGTLCQFLVFQFLVNKVVLELQTTKQYPMQQVLQVFLLQQPI